MRGLFSCFEGLCGFCIYSPTDSHTVPAARARGSCFDVHSLPRGKERTKKTDFGLPKSVFCQNANAKAEFFYFCEKMSRATAPRPFRTAGFQRVLDPLARFLVTSCRVTRSNIKKSKPISARRRRAVWSSGYASIKNFFQSPLSPTRTALWMKEWKNDLVEAVLGPVETVEIKFSLIPQRFFGL